jgi:hypothetical protein
MAFNPTVTFREGAASLLFAPLRWLGHGIAAVL